MDWRIFTCYTWHSIA